MLRLLQRLVASERCMRVLGALSPALQLWHPDSVPVGASAASR